MADTIPQLDIEAVLAQLTLEEKVKLLSGIDGWHTYAVPRLGVRSVRVSDGPNGVRGTRFFNGVPAACLPCETALGATFDQELVQQAGRLLGLECKAKGAAVLLGPTINIQRGPLGGRGFESFSEDPVLSGTLAGAYCQGVQSEQVVPTLKHFVCNDQEHERNAVSAEVTDRALREIYLLPFQLALSRAGTAKTAIMTAYNRLNGRHVSELPSLLQGILREEWRFGGLVMSDWWGTYSVSGAVNAGLDLEMPGPSRFRGDELVRAVRVHKVKEHVVDERVRSVLRLVNLAAATGLPENAPEHTRDVPETRALLRRAAAESVVLLKNEGGVLPLSAAASDATGRPKKTLVIGPNANVASYCGGGSASLPAYYTVTPLEGVRAKLAAAGPSASAVTFLQGVYGHKELPGLGDRLRTVEVDGDGGGGRPGFTLRVYTEPASVAGRKAVDTVYLKNSTVFLMDYDHPAVADCDDLYYMTVDGVFTPDESGVYDFGMSVSGTGELFIDGQLVIDNKTRQRAGNSFFGTGTVEEIGALALEAGRDYRLHIEFGTAPTAPPESKLATFGPGGFKFGCCKQIDTTQAIADAAAAAAEADQVILCIGLNGDWESEGYDRPDMALPPGSDDLVRSVVAAQPNTVVVIQSGMPVAMPWAEGAKAIVQAWYGGNEAGNGIADVLFGDVNPSAKLPVTFPVSVEENPAFLNFRSEAGRVLYGEDVYVGYRYYEKKRLQPLFTFGHGLSYTTFSLSDLTVSSSATSSDKTTTSEKITVTVAVTNTGTRSGAETILVYVAPPADLTSTGVRRPLRELKGFVKVPPLKPQEKTTATVTVSLALATSFWDEYRGAWQSDAGEYTITAVGTGPDNVLSSTLSVPKSRWWKGLLEV